MSARAPRELARWLPILRLPTLVVVEAPVLVATCLLWAAHAAPAWTTLLVTLLAVGLGLLATQVCAAYLDHARSERNLAVPGSAFARRPGTRQVSALLEAGIYPLDALWVAAVLFALSAVPAIVLGVSGGLPVWLLGVGGLALAAIYAVGGAGLTRAGVMGYALCVALGLVLVAFSMLAQHQPASGFALWLGVGLGLFAAAWLEAARLAGTAPVGNAVVFGETTEGGRGRVAFAGTLGAAYVVVLVAALPPGAPHGALAVLLSLPVTMLPLTGVWRSRNRATLPPIAWQTLRAYAMFAFWLAIGLLLGGLYLRLLGLIGA